jgi:hypothetical protein
MNKLHSITITVTNIKLSVHDYHTRKNTTANYICNKISVYQG